MSFKTKAIAYSAAALLAAAGGLYAFTPDSPQSASVAQGKATLDLSIGKAGVANSQEAATGPSSEKADAQGANATVSQSLAGKDQPANQTHKKLTRQQLTPPIATVDEKLQKAAEEESNF